MKVNESDVRLSPYLNVKNAAEAIEFYSLVFGAQELYRLVDPADGRVGHAELKFGNSVMMISDEYPDFGALSPVAFGGSPVKLHLTVPNIDETFARAIEKGAIELRAVKDQFHGNRGGVLTDPFGHIWHLDTKLEDIPPAEMQQRWDSVGTS